MIETMHGSCACIYSLRREASERSYFGILVLDCFMIGEKHEIHLACPLFCLRLIAQGIIPWYFYRYQGSTVHHKAMQQEDRKTPRNSVNHVIDSKVIPEPHPSSHGWVFVIFRQFFFRIHVIITTKSNDLRIRQSWVNAWRFFHSIRIEP